MKRFRPVLHYALALAGILLAGWYGPWWAPAIFLAAWTLLLRLPMRKAILEGGLLLAIAYGLAAGWMYLADASDLLGKTAGLFGGLPSYIFLLITVVIGGVTGVLTGWLGSALGKVIFEEKTN